MFMQMPLPAPHGSASHSFTSEKDAQAGRRQRGSGSQGHPGPPTRPAHPRSSAAAGATGSQGCNGRSSRRGPGCTPRGHRCSG